MLCRSVIFFGFCCVLGVALEPYCDRNETITTLRPVTKTRTVTKRPSKWKFWKQPETRKEEYVEHEEHLSHKLVSACCKGFHMTELGICEPVCERGCPTYASCVEPGRCQCNQGYISAVSYKDGSHYCEPICTQMCPSGTLCVEPNKCACKDGYKPLNAEIEGGECEPVCILGDGCKNGMCVGAEDCVCDRGYIWHEETSSCKENEFSTFLDNDFDGLTTDEQVTNNDYTFEDSTDTESTNATDKYDTTVCPVGFLLYKGDCREEIFTSNEGDCNIVPCGLHQICLSNGTCSCKEGYTSTDVINGVGPACELFVTDSEPINGRNSNAMWLSIIGIMTICGVVLLALGSIVLIKRRHEAQLRDVEAKAEYINRKNEETWVL